MDQIRSKIRAKSSKAPKIQELNVLYTCEKDPSQFFCQGDKLLVAKEFEYLLDILQQAIQDGELDS